MGEHFLTEIRGGHLAIRALALDFQCQIAGAGRHVEHAGRFLDAWDMHIERILKTGIDKSPVHT